MGNNNGAAAGDDLSRGETTRRKLITAGIRLFSTYGYDSTSTRMIVQEAGVNLSAISFHFSSKEALYAACLQFIAAKAEKMYDEAFERAEALLERGAVTAEEARRAILEIMHIQLTVAFGKRYRSSLKLVYWEQINAMNSDHPVTTVIFEKIELVVAKLISAGAGMPFKNAMVASRFINGGVISFGEHSLLVKYSLGLETEGDELPEWIRRQITEHVYSFIDKLFAGAAAEKADS